MQLLFEPALAVSQLERQTGFALHSGAAASEILSVDKVLTLGLPVQIAAPWSFSTHCQLYEHRQQHFWITAACVFTPSALRAQVASLWLERAACSTALKCFFTS